MGTYLLETGSVYAKEEMKESAGPASNNGIFFEPFKASIRYYSFLFYYCAWQLVFYIRWPRLFGVHGAAMVSLIWVPVEGRLTDLVLFYHPRYFSQSFTAQVLLSVPALLRPQSVSQTARPPETRMLAAK